MTSTEKLKGTPYSQELGNDCSGIFHQMLNGMRDQCPNSIFPTKENARSSRHIAAWYYDHDNLQIIRDPKSQGDLIQPGVVMFYGYTANAKNYDYNNLSIESLSKRGTGINHVSIVTEVVRDENGVLQSYEMFHGRSPGRPADFTTSRLKYFNNDTLPVYGNWGEPWLAIANVLTVKEDLAEIQ